MNTMVPLITAAFAVGVAGFISGPGGALLAGLIAVGNAVLSHWLARRRGVGGKNPWGSSR